MFLNYRYVGKLEENEIKIEIYETCKRTLFLKKVYAYQVFDKNKLVAENEHFIPNNECSLYNNIVTLANQFVKLSEYKHLEIEYSGSVVIQ